MSLFLWWSNLSIYSEKKSKSINKDIKYNDQYTLKISFCNKIWTFQENNKSPCTRGESIIPFKYIVVSSIVVIKKKSDQWIDIINIVGQDLSLFNWGFDTTISFELLSFIYVW